MSKPQQEDARKTNSQAAGCSEHTHIQSVIPGSGSNTIKKKGRVDKE